MNQRAATILTDLLQPGLTGIPVNADRQKVHIQQHQEYQSFFIDEYYRVQYPNDNRWDYVVHNNTQNRYVFIEVHPATTTGVTEVCRKYNWLRDMITVRISELNWYNNIRTLEYYWLWTDNNKLNKNAPQYKSLKTHHDYRNIKLRKDVSI